MKNWDIFSNTDQNSNSYMGRGLPPGSMGVRDYDHDGWLTESPRSFGGDDFFRPEQQTSSSHLENSLDKDSPSVQRYESAKRRLELEGYQSNNLVMPGYHEYTVETEICTIGSKGCTEQEVFDQLRRFPAPQRFGSPDRTVGVKTGDRSFALMVGQVVHWVGRRMLTNTTIENRHLLDPGVVIREVITTGNKIIIRTSGYGTGPLPQINSGRPSKLIWSDRTDSKIVAAIRKKSEEK